MDFIIQKVDKKNVIHIIDSVSSYVFSDQM